MRYGTYGTEFVTTSSNSDVWTIISLLVAVCGGIVLYFTFLNPNNSKNYTGFTKKIYDFLSFTTISLEAILKICYLIVALFITIISFSLLKESLIAFLLFLAIGNLIVRVIFEGSLLILMIYRKLCNINDLMKDKNEQKK